jgi:ubiquitin-protein ligase
MSPRIRRLKSDYERLMKRFDNWPVVRLTGKAGLPPEFYRFTYRLNGLVVSPGGDIVERGEHVLEVNLSLGYPRRAPQCKMLQPVFHPNFDEASVCIGDFWAPSESLEDLIVRIGRMIAYQEYNTKSPLNGLAAKWADENQHLLPVDSTEVAPPLERAAPPPVPPAPSQLESAEASASADAGPWTGRIIIP